MSIETPGKHLDDEESGTPTVPARMFFEKDITESLLHGGDYLCERKRRDQPDFEERNSWRKAGESINKVEDLQAKQ